MPKQQSNACRKNIIADLMRVLSLYPLPELSGKRIFMTGGTGFIGYWLLMAIAQLNTKDAQISVVALSRNPDIFLNRYPEFRQAAWLQFIQGDVRDYPFPDGKFDLFMHGASDTSPEAANRALELFDTIVLGSRHVLDHALACGTRRVLIISSGAIYGEQAPEITHIAESATHACHSSDPADAYGEGKRAMEMLAVCYGREYGLEPVIARCFAFIGYGLPPHLAVGQLIGNAMSEGRIEITGDGKTVRSYLYAADLAIWLLALACKGEPGTPYNVGSDEAFRLDELAQLISNTLGLTKQVEILGRERSNKRIRYVPDVSCIRQGLGVELWTDIKTGIKRMADCV
jgi:nucleoside-diphosphate-sugar epimerase